HELGQNNTVDEARRFTRAAVFNKTLRPSGLRRIVGDQQTHEDVGVQADHRFLLTARKYLATAARRIASSISLRLTVRLGLGRIPINSLSRLATGVMTARLSFSTANRS